MNRNDFKIGDFVGSKHNIIIYDWSETNFPARNTTINSSIPGAERSLVSDNKNYLNRELTIDFMIKSKNISDFNSEYSLFMKSIDTGKYNVANFYFDPEYQYQVVFNSITRKSETDALSEYSTYEVKFTAAPFKYLINVASVNVGTMNTTVTNPMLFNSKPYIKIVGSGTITLNVNSEQFIFNDVEGSIELDSSLQSVFKMKDGKAINQNNKMVIGPFPEFKPGVNNISISAGTATVEPRWRSL